MLKNNYVSPEEMLKKVDAITSNDVMKVAKNLTNPSIATYGDLTNAPYLDSFKF